MRYLLFILLTILPGTVGVVIFGYYALIDWDSLQKAYSHFAQVAQSNADLPSLFLANSMQMIHRINLLADGVWTLLSAIVASIGLHGLFTRSAPGP